jgi:hypothetical protein
MKLNESKYFLPYFNYFGKGVFLIKLAKEKKKKKDYENLKYFDTK